MRLSKITFALAAVLLGALVSGTALAHHGFHHHHHASFGLFIGAPAFYPYYYPAPYYYYPYYYSPPVVVAPSSPPAYVEQGNSPSAPGQTQSYWYYCTDTQSYYPYVKECPGGWQRVVPQPPNS